MQNMNEELLKSVKDGINTYYRIELEAKLNKSTTEEKETISDE